MFLSFVIFILEIKMDWKLEGSDISFSSQERDELNRASSELINAVSNELYESQGQAAVSALMQDSEAMEELFGGNLSSSEADHVQQNSTETEANL